MAAQVEALKLTERQRSGRAINAVAELLRSKLSVPNIYLQPPPALIAADVLAVDRAGAGDLHAVEIQLPDKFSKSFASKRLTQNETELSADQTKAQREAIKNAHRHFMSMPAHFRYLAIPVAYFDALQFDLARLGIFAQDGIGRLGVILIDESGGDLPRASLSLHPERFRVDPAKLKAIETKLLAKSRPDIEVRI